MSAPLALVGGAVLGIAAGSLLVPLTRRALTLSAARTATLDLPVGTVDQPPPRITRRQWAALAAVSGFLPAYVLSRVGWSANALPPLLLLMGLVQLAYCDLARRLLPKTLVYALTVAVVTGGLTVTVFTGEWGRLLHASLGGLACFALFFVVNLMNPRWMAFGDVRLSLVFGFGLAWVSPTALFQAFLYANLLAAVVASALIVARRADRGSALPFGLFMTLGAGIVLIAWT